jgi:hypothetical protein
MTPRVNSLSRVTQILVTAPFERPAYLLTDTQYVSHSTFHDPQLC